MSCQKAVAPDKITATRLPENSILQPWRNSNESTGGPGQVSIEISKAQKFHLLLWWFLYNNPIPEYFPRPYLFPWGFGTLKNWPLKCLALELLAFRPTRDVRHSSRNRRNTRSRLSSDIQRWGSIGCGSVMSSRTRMPSRGQAFMWAMNFWAI